MRRWRRRSSPALNQTWKTEGDEPVSWQPPGIWRMASPLRTMWGRRVAAAARFLRVPQPSSGQAQPEQPSRWARALPERIWSGETASSSMVGVSKARQPSVARSSTLLR